MDWNIITIAAISTIGILSITNMILQYKTNKEIIKYNTIGEISKAAKENESIRSKNSAR